MARSPPDFARDYVLGGAPALLDLECCVLGSDYRATSWTTRAEAERIAAWLRLGPQSRFLDIGAGAGWPALHLARISGCRVALLDVPLAALQIARDRALRDGIANRCAIVVGDGARLPFASGTFDTIGHSDVLCCLAAKGAVLLECRRVATAGATMAFSVIAVARSLRGAARALAIASGPAHVDAPGDYAVLLERSGWRVTAREDVTAEFARTLKLSIDGLERRACAIEAALGSSEYEAKMKRRTEALRGVDQGLLVREIFVAVADASVRA
jgi:sarcosine/dimethylglycine N-methyltransferase